jgi:hypothetical protein
MKIIQIFESREMDYHTKEGHALGKLIFGLGNDNKVYTYNRTDGTWSLYQFEA